MGPVRYDWQRVRVDRGLVSEDYYRRSPEKDPKGPDSPGSYRVLRGGSWNYDPMYVRASYRSGTNRRTQATTSGSGVPGKLLLSSFSLFLLLGLGEAPEEIFLMTAKAQTELPVVVSKTYDFSVWLIQKVEHFPRSYRFSVGDRLVSGVLDLLLRLVDAAYAREKAAILGEVTVC